MMAFTDPEKRKAYYRDYRKKHPERCREWQKVARDKRNEKPEERLAHNELLKAWRLANIDYVRDYKRTKRRETYDRVQQLKASLGCARCPERHPAALDFHHENDDKENAVSQMINKCGWDKLMLEIEKCTVLCSNCHRKLHWEANR